MARALHKLESDELYCDAAKAVLEHHYDNHSFCGPWCRRKRMSQEERDASGKYYRHLNDKDDAELYSILQEILARFACHKGKTD